MGSKPNWLNLPFFNRSDFKMNTIELLEDMRANTIQLRKRLGDIPAKIAMICWNPVVGDQIAALKPYADGRVLVVPHPDEKDLSGALCMSDTDGACWDHWQDMTDSRRVDALLVLAIEIGVTSGIPMKDVHEAFCVIPEYRARIARDTERKTI